MKDVLIVGSVTEKIKIEDSVMISQSSQTALESHIEITPEWTAIA
ncbi:hypothetical protein BCM14_0105 [Jezberella montanilacus]|uniref:Uncharacterized protein n=1 Tax=Jezberella montanilacus TaxID=323426 RepID=A0A2T0XQ57_9BURK|nr:hypothetical protein [Jezberella montanilacus]PRZ01085.1 hypothetical protein BCM14_0105 [Jezberella montanilacus]